MKKYIQINNSKHLSYLIPEIAEKYMDKFIYIQNKIAEKLKDYPNFNGIDFNDVSAGGIQIRGHHIEINRYTYGDEITLNYDLTNMDACIDKFVEMWKKIDNPDCLREFRYFIKQGEQYGWD